MIPKKDYSNLRTGVIGVGSMGQNHARVYSEISNLVGVSDLDKEQGREIADRFGVKYFEDYEEMLNEVDAVTIAVPTVLHRKIAENVAKFGVNMLVEKPLAHNSKDAQFIVDIARTNGVTLTVGHVERHNPVVSYAKKAISSGKWGEVITLSSRRVSSFPERIHDVGVLFDLSIHDIDISNYLANSKVSSVFASGGRMKAKHEDHVNIIMEYESGIISICETNWLTPMKIRKLGITTSDYFVELDYQNQSIDLFTSKYKKVDKKNLYSTNFEVESKSIPILKAEPLQIELIDFLTSIEKQEKPLVSGLEGLEVVTLSEKLMKSLKNKEAIHL